VQAIPNLGFRTITVQNSLLFLGQVHESNGALIDLSIGTGATKFL
jgi:hypothetical protein